MPDYKFTIGNYPNKPSPKIKILTGQSFGRLLVIGFAGLTSRKKATWHCLCDCGNGRTIVSNNLTQHNQQSCGCLRIEKLRERVRTHGEAGRNASAEYCIYGAAKTRCTNPNAEGYERYGGRDIEFRFDSFKDFLKVLGRRPTSKHSIERLNNNGHYEEGNVKWATKEEQANNTRTNHFLEYQGRTQTVIQWERELKLPTHRAPTRLDRGWCIECALTAPLYGKCVHKT